MKFKLHDKRAALVDLGRHLGMFQEERNGNQLQVFKIEIHLSPEAFNQ